MMESHSLMDGGIAFAYAS